MISLYLSAALALAAGVHAAETQWVCLPSAKGATWDCRQGGPRRSGKRFVAPKKRPLLRQPYVAPAFSPQRPRHAATLSRSPWLDVLLPDPEQVAAREARRRVTQPAKPIPRAARPAIAATQPPQNTELTGIPVAVPATAYYIQLSAASRRGALARFARQHGLARENLFVVATRRNDAPWYQLLRGAFAQRSAANAALAALPDSLRRSGPWVRKLSSIDLEPASRALP